MCSQTCFHNLAWAFNDPAFADVLLVLQAGPSADLAPSSAPFGPIPSATVQYGADKLLDPPVASSKGAPAAWARTAAAGLAPSAPKQPRGPQPRQLHVHVSTAVTQWTFHLYHLAECPLEGIEHFTLRDCSVERGSCGAGLRPPVARHGLHARLTPAIAQSHRNTRSYAPHPYVVAVAAPWSCEAYAQRSCLTVYPARTPHVPSTRGRKQRQHLVG